MRGVVGAYKPILFGDFMRLPQVCRATTDIGCENPWEDPLSVLQCGPVSKKDSDLTAT